MIGSFWTPEPSLESRKAIITEARCSTGICQLGALSELSRGGRCQVQVPPMSVRPLYRKVKGGPSLGVIMDVRTMV